MNSADPGSSRGDLDQQLYARRQKVYPREVHGLFALLRTTAVIVLLGLYYGLPWVRWGDRQAVLFDLPERKFHIFGLTIWPQDFFYLSALLIIAALSLFFFTALAGRLWCGYACPQTVWTEVFLWIERRIEGSRSQQMKRDSAPWTPRKLAVKSSKHFVWIVFSLWTGYTFVGYFTPIVELAGKIGSLTTGPWETFWVLFYGFATYGNAGWLREQVCIYMCPYARFQSAMFDRDTLIISYDPGRGEPRGSRKRGTEPRELGLGDCIDCTLCVQVCPTGIDIRDGLQYQCIGCAACIDACNDVMDRMGYRPGLIRYTTEHALEGVCTRLVRPRMAVYAALLVALTGAVLLGLLHRNLIELHVIGDRNALYRETGDGWIENVYTLRLLNKDNVGHVFRIDGDGIEGMRLVNDAGDVSLAPGEVVSFVVRVQADPAVLSHRSSRLQIRASALDDDGLVDVEEARFLGR
jgi:cytochrome c oxidase accessory protein FixG